MNLELWKEVFLRSKQCELASAKGFPGPGNIFVVMYWLRILVQSKQCKSW